MSQNIVKVQMARDLQRFYIKAGIDFKMVMYLCTNENTFLIQSAQFFGSCSFAAKFSCSILSCLIMSLFREGIVGLLAVMEMLICHAREALNKMKRRAKREKRNK